MRMPVLLSLAAIAVLLTGCATAGTGAGPDAAPTPTAACPQPIEGPTPTACVPYDPDAAMAENEHYRDRKDLTDEQAAAAVAPVAAATAALQPYADGTEPITENSVVTALTEAGFERDSIQTIFADRADGASVAFGISAEFGGCVFGGVSVRETTVAAGGYILDGGCLAMTGH
jgi:predicted small secreted protein